MNFLKAVCVCVWGEYSLLYQLLKGFIGTLYFQIVGENVYLKEERKKKKEEEKVPALKIVG